MIRPLIVAWLMLCSASLGGTVDPSVPDEKCVEYGRGYECVVPIFGDCNCGGAGGKPHKYAASAVVIDPRWIVTAAHVVKGKEDVRITLKGSEHRMRRVVVSDRFREETLGRYDIALCESEEEMKLDFYPELYEGSDEVGKVAGICGYGATGTFSSGSVRVDGLKRGGSNRVVRSENHVLVCSSVDSPRTSLEMLIAVGDSGGGLFIDQKLAGINSFVMASDGKSDSDYGDECCHTRVSIFVPWIRGHMRGDAPEEVE